MNSQLTLYDSGYPLYNVVVMQVFSCLFLSFNVLKFTSFYDMDYIGFNMRRHYLYKFMLYSGKGVNRL